MAKINHQKTLQIEWLKNILQQIGANYQTSGTFDPSCVKMPDTSVKFKGMFNNLNDNLVMYRFLDFEKFKNLIEERKLAFISPLIYDDDEKEAECFDEYKIFVYKCLKFLYEKNRLNLENAGIKKTNIKEIDLMHIASRWEKIFQYCRRNVFVSCWTLNDPQNKYMWEQYTKNEPTAIAIKTNIRNFKKAILKTGHGDHYIDQIRYIDWNSQPVNNIDYKYVKTLDTLRYQLFHKQKKFKEDNEIRILIDNLTCNVTPWYGQNINTILGDKNFDYDQYFEDKPIKFLKEEVLLEELITEIILSPFATEVETEKIREILIKNNLSHKISSSLKQV